MQKWSIIVVLLTGLFASCAYHPNSRDGGRLQSFWASTRDDADSMQNSPLDPQLKERFKAEIRRLWHAPYMWGGASPQGTDCSGLVYVIYQRAANISIPRSVGELYNQGLWVPAQLWQFGDLVFFSKGRGQEPGHVGLYIENGFFIHASVSSGVILSRLSDSPFMETYIGARRFLE
jgi:cell wall-associated NlpC family hydrolase